MRLKRELALVQEEMQMLLRLQHHHSMVQQLYPVVWHGRRPD
jgi:hypothetical protein